MPELQTEMKRTFEELRSTYTALTERVDAMEKRNDEGGGESPELRKNIEAVEAAMKKIETEYDELRKEMQRPKYSPDGNPPLDAEQELRKSRFLLEMRYGVTEAYNRMTPEQRSLIGTSDQDGNSLAPIGFESEIITAAYDEATIRPLCQARPTGMSSVMLPAMSQPAVGWGRNGVDVPEQDLNTGGERIEIFDLTALILIHNNTLEDAAADVWSELIDEFNMAVPEAEDIAFTSGAGNDSPQGFLADPDVIDNVTVTGVADDITDTGINGIDTVIEMQHELKQTYARRANFVMNRRTQGKYRMLKDDTGRYLWQPPVQAGDPATLSGDPVAISQGMPDIAANSLPLAYGDLSRGYAIRDRQGIIVQRLVERYAEKRSTGFLLTKRVGGKVKLAEAFRVMKVST